MYEYMKIIIFKLTFSGWYSVFTSGVSCLVLPSTFSVIFSNGFVNEILSVFAAAADVAVVTSYEYEEMVDDNEQVGEFEDNASVFAEFEALVVVDEIDVVGVSKISMVLVGVVRVLFGLFTSSSVLNLLLFMQVSFRRLLLARLKDFSPQMGSKCFSFQGSSLFFSLSASVLSFI